MHIVRLPNTSFDLDVSRGRIQKAEDDRDTTSYVAIEKDQIIGVQVVYRSRSNIHCRGTVVRPYRQQKHVAYDLWEAMIECENPKKIVVQTISHRGYSLIESMREEYPDIKWEVDIDDGIRSLRKPKKKKSKRRRKRSG